MALEPEKLVITDKGMGWAEISLVKNFRDTRQRTSESSAQLEVSVSLVPAIVSAFLRYHA